MTPVTVVDYGASNMRSVVNALESLGRSVKVVDAPDGLRDAAALVLPGVGAFGDGMAGLRKRELLEPLTEAVKGRCVPFLGICLGMQMLADEGLENGRHDGLAWIPGVVKRVEPGDPRLKVPHVGWNDLTLPRPSVLFKDMETAPVVYFLHGYALEVATPEVVTATCTHGVELVAAVEDGNVFGVQFHPEKSQRAGLQILENFLRVAAL
jgi:glutamine amidotransferase